MDVVRVKFTHGHRALDPLILKQTPGSSGRWGRYQFLVNEDVAECDWWVVGEAAHSREQTMCPPENVILLTWEPPSRTPPFRQAFLDQFATVVTADRNLPHPDLRLGLQGHTWHLVSKTYDQLVADPPPAKSRDLSIVSSNKTSLPGHRTRLALALALKEHFGERADLFGSGLAPFDDKWDVLAPYRYTVAVENDTGPDVMTEKLTDCFLAETFPFYAGCTNVEDYFPEGSFLRFDPSDVPGTIERIEATMADPEHYKRALPALREAKRRHLEQHSLFPMLATFIEGLEAEHRSGPPRPVTLEPEFARPSLAVRAVHKLRMLAGGRRRGGYVR
jgi:hypothetical protein